MIDRVRYRIGRRGSVLLFFFVLDVLFGYSFLAEPASFANKADLLLSYYAWGWIWIGVGIICLISAPMKSDRVAYACASAIKTAWALASGYAWIKDGIPRLWVSVVIWLAFAGLVLIISSWPESFETHQVRANGNGGTEKVNKWMAA